MKIDKVTITGADDSTDPGWMLEMSGRFPFVEWGILVSERNEGRPRFPSLQWMSGFGDRCHMLPRHIAQPQRSLHVCGKWVRQICAGDWTGLRLRLFPVLTNYSRVQLNFHAYQHLLTAEFFGSALDFCRLGQQLIFQVDGVNDGLVYRAIAEGINAVPLFDLSSGAGVVPKDWPEKQKDVYCGYAGGLGPENVLQECDRISKVVPPGEHIWIDMESRVRTPDDEALDCNAVETVLSLMAASEWLSA